MERRRPRLRSAFAGQNAAGGGRAPRYFISLNSFLFSLNHSVCLPFCQQNRFDLRNFSQLLQLGRQNVAGQLNGARATLYLEPGSHELLGDACAGGGQLDLDSHRSNHGLAGCPGGTSLVQDGAPVNYYQIRTKLGLQQFAVFFLQHVRLVGSGAGCVALARFVIGGFCLCDIDSWRSAIDGNRLADDSWRETLKRYDASGAVADLSGVEVAA